MTDKKKNYSYRKIDPKYLPKVKTGEPPRNPDEITEKKDTEPLISCIQYRDDKFLEFHVSTVAELQVQLQSGFYTWINIDGIHETKLINDIGHLFGLENLSIEDIVNTSGRPKFEEFDDYIYCVIKDLYCPKGDDFGLEQISMIIKESVLLTFQEEPGDVFDGVRSRLRNGTSKIRSRGTDYLAYSLMDAVIDNYFIVVESFDHYLDNLEDLLYATTHRRQLNKIKEAKKHFNTLKRTVHPMKEMVYNMYRAEHKFITKKTHIYIRDLYDHITSIEDTIDQSRDKVYGLMGIYQSGTNNLMNSIVKTLTIVSTIFMALSLIAGIYGMNFDPDKSPYNMPELDWVYGYPFALALMVITSIGLIIYFRFKKWI
jgi:magnesium transporter